MMEHSRTEESSPDSLSYFGMRVGKGRKGPVRAVRHAYTLGTYARIGPYVRCRIALTPPDPDEASPQGEDKTPRRASGQTSVRGPQVPHRPPPLHQPRVRRPGPHPVTAS